MKILMQGKVDLFESGGGDKIQIENTAKELQKLGVDVEIKPGFTVNYNDYDLIHLFQLDWTPETYLYAKKAKLANKPIVLSPIHHSLEELKKFDDLYVFDFRRFSKLLFKDQFKRDTLKNVYKSFFNAKRIYPTFVSILLGLKKMQIETLKMADIVLVQTNLEANDLQQTYKVPISFEKIPNGVGSPFLNFDKNEKNESPLNISNYIVCVGRIEARKNQLTIIEAVEAFRKVHNEDVNLVFVGKQSTAKHPEYVYRFNRLVKKHSWVHHVGEINYENMPTVYKNAKIGVSASWFETTGLTSLEALFCGTNAVAAGKRAHEYLGAHVSYCQPDNVKSIEKAIATQFYAPKPEITDKMLSEYTWENAAKKTLAVYKGILNNA